MSGPTLRIRVIGLQYRRAPLKAPDVGRQVIEDEAACPVEGRAGLVEDPLEGREDMRDVGCDVAAALHLTRFEYKCLSGSC
jgi:hypothetical protein